MKQPSHLSEAQAHGKQYEYKSSCLWCGCAFDINESNSDYCASFCSKDCERNEDYIVSNDKEYK